jgi:uncharacterized protein (DUF2237 family)
MEDLMLDQQLNLFGEPLQACCKDPLTGYFRDGYCKTCSDDIGQHIVCAQMTDAFLDFTLSKGNDLRTARPAFHFPGLAAGDFWCVCALRWLEALHAGVAPPINPNATHALALQVVDKETLLRHALTP